MSVEFFEEKFSEQYPTMIYLFEKHWEEVGYENEKVKFAPDYEKYIDLERLGMLTLLVARDKGNIVGYCIDITNTHMHHKHDIYAVNDVFYVKTEYRKSDVPLEFLQCVQQYHRDNGCTAHLLTMMEIHRYDKLAKAAGYSQIETVWGVYLQE